MQPPAPRPPPPVPGAAAGLQAQPVPECVLLRDQLLERIHDLHLPPNFLDQVGGACALARRRARRRGCGGGG